MTETGVQDCVKTESPLAVTKREYSLDEFSSPSRTTCRMDNALLVATSGSTVADALLFHGKIVAGTLTTAPPFRWLPPISCLSSFAGFSVANDDDDVIDDAVLFRPRNGNNKTKTNALMRIIKLLHARSDNSAFILPLAPDVRIKAADDDDDASFALNTASVVILSSIESRNRYKLSMSIPLIILFPFPSKMSLTEKINQNLNNVFFLGNQTPPQIVSSSVT